MSALALPPPLILYPFLHIPNPGTIPSESETWAMIFVRVYHVYQLNGKELAHFQKNHLRVIWTQLTGQAAGRLQWSGAWRPPCQGDLITDT